MVLRTFLRFLQARVEVAAAAEVLVLVTLTAVVATFPVNKHWQLFES
jgi:hypothetical protein